jgi:hypothetical protein
VWDLSQRLGGQLRIAGSAVIGFDFVAALALADALAIDRLAVAELLPTIEGAMVRKINERMEGARDG